MLYSTPLARLDDQALRAYLATVDAAFQSAATHPIRERYFSIGGYNVCIRAYSQSLLAHMTQALMHLSIAAALPDLTIHLWDSATSGTPSPLSPLAWYSQQYGGAGADQFNGLLFDARGELAAFNTLQVRTSFHIWPHVLQTLDLSTNQAHYWIQDAAEVPYYEASAPFSRLLAWWMSERHRLFMHAGAVGNAAGGVLLVGEPGAGKSTTSLACLGSGLGFASDDYCLVQATPQPQVYSLYATAKLKGHADVARFPHLTDAVVNRADLASQKALMLLYPAYAAHLVAAFPLRAILIPTQSGATEPRLTPVSSSDALRAMAPSTLRQHPGSSRSAWSQMTQLVKQTPSYRLEVGPNLATIPEVIGALVERLSASQELR